ncbi:hypothetical protein, partial [uncultured Sutterella sp.]|uniref:hypothetical protein n=1 Tax=uncultured Sutterella sp. TaxID=286133 RepID=UPI0025E80196
MIRMQMTKLTIALTAVMTAFSTHAVGQDGISNDEFIFNDDATIIANASSGTPGINSGIAATNQDTTVTIVDGKTLGGFHKFGKPVFPLRRQ